MFIVALTGGIGSGKSTVAGLFSQLGIPVIDADDISRELTAPKTPLSEKIIAYFGQTYQDEKGVLNRARLRQRVFEVSRDRQWLESLLHPAVYQQMKKKIEALKSFSLEKKQRRKINYIICVIPLLFETQRPDFIDRVIVVDAPEEIQLHRAMQRDHLSASQIKKILKSQCDRQTRLAGADDIITNTGILDALKLQVKALDKKYQLL